MELEHITVLIQEMLVFDALYVSYMKVLYSLPACVSEVFYINFVSSNS